MNIVIGDRLFVYIMYVISICQYYFWPWDLRSVAIVIQVQVLLVPRWAYTVCTARVVYEPGNW